MAIISIDDTIRLSSLKKTIAKGSSKAVNVAVYSGWIAFRRDRINSVCVRACVYVCVSNLKMNIMPVFH